MMFVLMAMLLVGAVTVSAMQVIGADVGGSIEELEADQVFNIANAGVHYAIGKLQLGSAGTYAGETLTVTNGSTTLGKATITVNCVDTTSINNWAPPCSSSAYPGMRRIISVGGLQVSGPARTVVAVVQGSGGGSYALCALSTSPPSGYYGVNIGGGEESGRSVYGDIASNSTIYAGCGECGSGYLVNADSGSPQKYHGNATAAGTATCSASCTTQIQGTTTSGAAAPCGTPAPPAGGWVSGGSGLTVPCAGTSIAAGTTTKQSSVTFFSVTTPATPTVTQFGATGTTQYWYHVIALDTCGQQSIESSGASISTSYSPLSAVNYNKISWTSTGASGGYDIVRNTGNKIGHVASAPSGTAMSFNDTGQSATSYNTCLHTVDLTINTTAGQKTVLNVTGSPGMTMSYCSRLIVAGAGTVELDFSAASGQVLILAPSTHFGVTSADTQTTPTPVAASQLIVNVNSNSYSASSSGSAVYLGGGSGGDQYEGSGSVIAAGTINATNGLVYVHTGSGEDSQGGFYGAISASLINVSGIIHEDTSGATAGNATNFTKLVSWKDQ